MDLKYSTAVNETHSDVFYMRKIKSEIQTLNEMKRKSIDTAKKLRNDNYVKMKSYQIAKRSKKYNSLSLIKIDAKPSVHFFIFDSNTYGFNDTYCRLIKVYNMYSFTR